MRRVAIAVSYSACTVASRVGSRVAVRVGVKVDVAGRIVAVLDRLAVAVVVPNGKGVARVAALHAISREKTSPNRKTILARLLFITAMIPLWETASWIWQDQAYSNSIKHLNRIKKIPSLFAFMTPSDFALLQLKNRVIILNMEVAMKPLP